jgi:beta-mannosidase
MLNIESTKLEFEFRINKPQIWWPHNLGTPYLYSYVVVLEKIKSKQILDSINVTIGLRTVRHVLIPDKTFSFTVNGFPIFAKGANYVPHNFFVTQGLKNPNTYEELIKSAVDANFNMIRVWGGGHYEL